MASQKEVGTYQTGFVTAAQSEPPRRCNNCKHFRVGLHDAGWCNGTHVMADPELKTRRNAAGLVRVGPADYCWFFDSKS